MSFVWRMVKRKWLLRRRDAMVRRDAKVLQVELRDLGERRRRDRAAEDPARWLVHDDEHHEPRLLDRHHADERRDVLAGRVAVWPRHLCRAGLAGNGVPR